MLQHLFGSSLRVHCLQTFLDHPEKSWTIRAFAKLLHAHPRTLLIELQKLAHLEILVVREGFDEERKEKALYYSINTNFLLYPELRALFVKARLLIEKDLIAGIERIGSIRYLVLTGILAGIDGVPTDLLIVGKVNRKKLKHLVHRFERLLNHEINYTVFSRAEFKYRRDITDLFLFSILEDPRKIIVIDRLLPS